MKRCGVLVFLVAVSTGAFAQFTTVTGTVTDPNGLPYANGAITAKLALSGVTPTLNGGSFAMTGSAGLSTTGAFTMRLADSNVMSPSAQWSFTVCSATGTVLPAGGTGPQCFTPAPITITGASQSITASLTPVPALSLITGGGGGGGGFSYNACAVGLVCNGSTNDTTALATLLGTIGSAQATLYLTKTTLLNTISIPANVTLDFTPGGAVKIATGQTVTIVGPINASPQQIFFNVASGQGATSFTGNHTLTRISPLWWGVDCTGTNDNAPVWNQIMAFTGDNSTYIMPQNCIDNHGSTVNVPSRVGFKLLSETRAQSGAGNTQRPIERWSCTSGCTGGMWNFIANQTPTVEGFQFDNHTGSPGTIAYFLNFDGNPSTYIGTEATARYNTYENDQGAAVQSAQSPPFSAIQINLVSGQNHEKNVITDSDFACSQSIPFRESDSGQISTSTSILTCGLANCTYLTDAAVGDRLRVSYATGLLDTTISSITDNNHLVFAAANGGSNQSNARTHFRQAYGYGITIGSVNSKHNTLERLSFTQCNRGLNIVNGSFNAKHIGGTFNDVTAYISNISEPSELDYMETESSLREVQTGTSMDSPLTLRHLRNSIGGSAESDGFLLFNNSGGGSRILLSESGLQATPITNSVLIRAAAPQNMQLYSFANQWGPGVATTTNLGFTTFQNQPQTNLNWLISCGDFGITDMNGSNCFNFGGISPTLSGADSVNAINYGCSPSNTAAQNATCVTNAFAALYANGGGALYFPLATAPYKIGCFTIPNDGIANSDGVFSTKPFRMFSSTPTSGYKMQAYGAALDLRCNTNARISLLAAGAFEIDHITLINGNTAGGDTVPFVLDIDAVVNIHDTTFVGDTSLVGTANLQDAIVLGGGGSTPGNTATSAFYGYRGTIQNNFFDHVQKAVYAHGSSTWSVNAMHIIGNQIWSNSGCSLNPCFAFDFGSSGADEKNIFIGNLFDGPSAAGPYYTAEFGVRGDVGAGNSFIANVGFDDNNGIVYEFGVNGGTTSSNNTVIDGSPLDGRSQMVKQWGTSSNCLILASSTTCGTAGYGTGLKFGDTPNPFITGDVGSGYPALWSGGATATGTNYAFAAGNAGDTYVNGGTDVYGTIASVTKTHLTASAYTISPPVVLLSTLTTNLTGGPFCVHETSGVLSATTADCPGLSNPMTTPGDMIVATTAGAPARLPVNATAVPQVPVSVNGATALAPSGVVPRASTCPSNIDTILAGDRDNYVSENDASACAVGLPAAGSAGFANNFFCLICNLGAGTATVTPTTSTISYTTGAAAVTSATSMPITTGKCAWVFSDNANYFAVLR